jgi:hypothetical protein
VQLHQQHHDLVHEYLNKIYDVKKRYGAAGDGTTDDYTAINDAITDAAADGGGIVYLPPGTYKVSGGTFALPAKVGLRGAGKRITRLLQANWSNHFIRASGSGEQTQKTTLSANANPMDNALSLTSLTGINPGDYYLLRATIAQSTENPSRYQGEMIQVRATPTNNPFGTNGTPAAGTVNLRGYIKDQYTTAAAAAIDGPILFSEGNQVCDLTIENTDPANTGAVHTAGFIRFVACRNFLLSNVELVGCDQAGIVIQNCVDGQVENCTLRDFSDVNNYTTSPQYYGYGISIELASENIAVSNCVGDRLRHFITTDGIDNRYGVPRGLIITGCVGKNCTDFPFDTHAPTADSVFAGCHAYNSAAGGFEIRGVNNQLLACSVSYAPKGIQIKPDAHGSTIKDCVIRHMDWAPGWTNSGGGAGPGVGIQLASSGTNAAKNVTIDNCRIEACGDVGIKVDGRSDNLHITNCSIFNVGRHTNGAGTQEAIYFGASNVIEGAIIANNVVGNAVGASSTEPATSGTSNSTPNTTLTTTYLVNWGAGGTYTNCKAYNNIGHRLATGISPAAPAGWTLTTNLT